MKTITDLMSVINRCAVADLKIKRIVINKKMLEIFNNDMLQYNVKKVEFIFGYPAKIGRVKEGFEVVVG